jgi:hypothetical protein
MSKEEEEQLSERLSLGLQTPRASGKTSPVPSNVASNENKEEEIKTESNKKKNTPTLS